MRESSSWRVVAFVALVLSMASMAFRAGAAVRSSASYSVDSESMDGGGGRVTSGSYAIQATIESVAAGGALSAAYSMEHGYQPGVGPGSATVVGRQLFYSRSAFDTNGAATGPGDDAAIAVNKIPLFYGQKAKFTNYTSYSRGINGLMIDVVGLPSANLAVSDFEFLVGNSTNLATWVAAAPPTLISNRFGAGVLGSDRITITWADNAVKKTWLRVGVLATADTGLGAKDLFFYGNATGETGNSSANARVDVIDETRIRVNPANSQNPVGITSLFDIDRNKLVNVVDETITRVNGTSSETALTLLDLTTLSAPSAGSRASLAFAALRDEADDDGEEDSRRPPGGGSAESRSTRKLVETASSGRTGGFVMVVEKDAAGGGFHITLSGEPGTLYRLEAGSSLDWAGGWEEATLRESALESGFWEWHFSSANAPSATFFRVLESHP